MNWSKTESSARFNLATSGVASFPLRELPVHLETLEINGDSGYGYPPLQKAIATYHGVDPDCVVESEGTSMANHLAMAAIIEPGDEVLIEHPAYGPILDIAHYLQANVKRFARTSETGWVVDSGEILHAITPKTRLIVITNLHNPTSALTPDWVLREVGEIARSVGALVLVDEVYLDAVYHGTPPTSFHFGPEFVVTSSLTKVYGVSGLRCGWILATPELAWKMRRLNDLYSATAVYPGLLLSVAVFKHLNLLREKARRIVEADRKLLLDFLTEESAFSAVWTEWGTTSFVQALDRNADDFLRKLRAEHNTSAVPGRFFEMPDHFRIGMGVNTEMFAEGLKRIRRAISQGQ
ncbi:MAG TPA: aminotransferase class I/II-fold pyridoxal phosphate-dependent enzyme [Candidatus Udaeobacter sp.]|nr:aminotransferase class I/II-fold pyridoxal phosphate-dependent enzyme [Candidatus Udaeobacter sp.]